MYLKDLVRKQEIPMGVHGHDRKNIQKARVLSLDQGRGRLSGDIPFQSEFRKEDRKPLKLKYVVNAPKIKPRKDIPKDIHPISELQQQWHRTKVPAKIRDLKEN